MTSDELRNATTSLSTALLLSIAVFLISLFFFSANIGNRPFSTRGEGREALVVQSMAATGSYMLPRRNGGVIPSKPPMFHWTALIAANIFGKSDEFSIRFSSAFSAAVLLAVLTAFVAVRAGVQTGLLAAFIAGSSFAFLRGATHARVDMSFALWLSLGFFGLFISIDAWRKRQRYLRWFLLTGIATAGAVLAKGPAALVLQVGWGAVYIAVLAVRNGRAILKSFPYGAAILGFAIAFVLSGFWYYVTYRHLGTDFLHIQLLTENIARVVEVTGEERGHRHPFYYVAIYVVQEFLPWSLLFPVVGAWGWSKRDELLRDEHRGFAFFGVVLVVFLSALIVSISKRDAYVLPTIPVFAYFTACCLMDLQQEWANYNRSLRTSAVIVGILGLAILFASAGMFAMARLPIDQIVAFAPKAFSLEPETRFIVESLHGDGVLAPMLVAVSLALLFSSIAWWRKQFVTASVTLGLATMLLASGIDRNLMPIVSKVSSPLGFIERIKKDVPADVPFYQYGHDFYSAAYYANRDLPLILSLNDKMRSERSFLLIREEDIPKLEQQAAGKTTIIDISDNLAANGEGRLILIEFQPAFAKATAGLARQN